MELKNKNILIISPEKWGDIYLSKHHYALKLAERGNKVFFLNPPIRFNFLKTGLSVSNPVENKNLAFLDYTYPVKGHLKLPSFLSSLIYKRLIQKIESTANIKLDIVWCFDTRTFSHWEFLRPEVTKILHIMDFNIINHYKKLYSQADFIFGVSRSIVKMVSEYNQNSYFINHGLSLREFDPFSQTNNKQKNNSKIKVGYIGNLLMTYIDWKAICDIVKDNPDIDFHFFGPYQPSNIGKDEFFFDVQKQLRIYKNVILEGKVPSSQLFEKISDIDIFLIAYNSEKYSTQLANPHKVLELLATGKTIVSSYLQEYEDKKDLMQMSKNNNELPQLFRQSIQNLSNLNSYENKEKRIRYALQNTYENQIKRIEKIINE